VEEDERLSSSSGGFAVLAGPSARIAWSAIALVVLAGCAGRGAVPPGSTDAATPAARARGTARFTIAVPRMSSAAGARRTPRYVSPATASMTIAVTTDPGGTSVVNETVGLTPTSTGCSSTLASTQCTLTITLPIGTYDATIATYDGANATGNELSQGQAVDFTIAEGHANDVVLTLSGIPASLRVSSPAYAVHGSQSEGFTLYGTAAQKLLAEALDPDGNVIIGPGAPSFTVASLNGSGYTIVNPTATTPNTLTLTPPGTNGQSEVFSLTAAYGDDTCSLSGATCSATFSVTNDIQTLYVAAGTNVATYTLPYTGVATLAIITNPQTPQGLALNAAGDLFVSTTGTTNEVQVYTPPYYDAPATFGDGSLRPGAMVLNAAGDLFVGYSAYPTPDYAVAEYAPPFTGGESPTTTITSGVQLPREVAMDTGGHLFVGDFVSSTVTVYAPSYTGTPTTISTGSAEPGALAVDAAGDLWVAFDYPGYVGDSVDEFVPPFTAGMAPTVTISNGIDIPEAIAFDGTGNLFVANDNGTVTEYKPPFASGMSPALTISNASGDWALAFDGAGNLFVQLQGRSAVLEYAPPYTGAPTTITTSGSPNAILLSP